MTYYIIRFSVYENVTFIPYGLGTMNLDTEEWSSSMQQLCVNMYSDIYKNDYIFNLVFTLV